MMRENVFVTNETSQSICIRTENSTYRVSLICILRRPSDTVRFTAVPYKREDIRALSFSFEKMKTGYIPPKEVDERKQKLQVRIKCKKAPSPNGPNLNSKLSESTACVRLTTTFADSTVNVSCTRILFIFRVYMANLLVHSLARFSYLARSVL